jgi:glycosyltransferase involved in cell wall biosynthesis
VSVRTPGVSIVVPTYNERESVVVLLPGLEELFSGDDYEVVVDFRDRRFGVSKINHLMEAPRFLVKAIGYRFG